MDKSEICITGHALAIARWEDNQKRWLEGNSFGLISKKPRLQKLIGNGGTLWIVLSRRNPVGGRLYSIFFRLQGCKSKTYSIEGKFGKYAIEGDPFKSTLYATKDAGLLLMSLRFEPYKPIRNIKKIGQSIETPRCLSLEDIKLLESNQAEVDRWSVFISYIREDEKIAIILYDYLQKLGIVTFRDRVSIPAGKDWENVMFGAIERARCFVILISKNTINSDWVKKELAHAQLKNIYIIPAVIDGNLNDWAEIGEVDRLQAIYKGNENLKNFSKKIAKSLPEVDYSKKSSKPDLP